jgi:CRP/FNR family nitrogen fixation transcriptional regulator
MLMKPINAADAAASAPILVEGEGAAFDKFNELVKRLDLQPKILHYDKGAEIFWEESATEYVYQVTAGAVRNYKLLSDGRCQITAFYLPGDIFGFDCGARRQTTADAIVGTAVRAVKRRDIEAAAGNDIFTSNLLLDITTEDLNHARNQIVLLGRKTAIERVAAFLLEMEQRVPSTYSMPLPMCRRDIGDYLGLTMETVSRALSQFHDQGILEFMGARHIALKNRALLRGMES